MESRPWTEALAALQGTARLLSGHFDRDTKRVEAWREQLPLVTSALADLTPEMARRADLADELLAVLKSVLREKTLHGQVVDAMVDVRAAIEKAEGKGEG